MGNRYTDLRRLALQQQLGLVVDLDGTLVPFAPTPDQATLDRGTGELLRTLSRLDGVTVMVVSGRPRSAVEPLIDQLPGLLWVAEHGSWRYDGTEWSRLPVESSDLDQLQASLEALVARFPMARVERKQLSVCLHWRSVPRGGDRDLLVSSAELIIGEWLEEHPDHDRLAAVDAVEVRPIRVHKGTAIPWLRERAADDTNLLAVGDDLTDEDTFAALGPGDLGVLVAAADRPTRATYRVDGPLEVFDLLRWVVATRCGAANLAPPVRSIRRADVPPRVDLLVLSNRLPPVNALADRTRQVGGLVSALGAALAGGDMLWLGWSGEYRDGPIRLAIDRESRPALAHFDYPLDWRQLFYGGFCNRSLWPLLHGFPSRVRYVDAEWDCYLTVNQAFAFAARSVASARTPVWIHDYHLMLVGDGLRQAGHLGPLGFFLHVPFPPPGVWATMPWATDVLRGLLAFDLVGVQTAEWRDNLIAAAAALLGAQPAGAGVIHEGRTIAIDAFPIGIDPEAFAPSSVHSLEIAALRESLGDRRLILGVDRLDYSKGIPERLGAFRRLLETRPEWRGRISMIQVSVPSRAEVPEYAELRRQIENLVGRINGEFGEANWVPVRYLYRSYDAATLAELYRAADVALVTPLCDGMNLVAKEFIAAQDPANPGVLVLSRFAGAADQLRAALLCNPYHQDAVAQAIEIALRMPPEERQRRHAADLAVVSKSTAGNWASGFLERLTAAGGQARGNSTRSRG